MDRVRDVCSTAFAMRRAQKVRVRQPLASLTIAGARMDRLVPYVDLIADEVNVKEVLLSPEIEEFADFRLQVNARSLGPRLGSETKKVIAASKQGEWTRDGEGVEVAGHRLEDGEFELKLVPKGDIACQALPSGDTVLVLDFELTAKLVREGLARDVIRAVQQARREAGLHVSDHVEVSLTLPGELREAVADFRDSVAEATLADSIDLDGGLLGENVFREQARVGSHDVGVALRKSGPS